ncbi:helix-turn-helix domain-containing protein [Cupriavidus respiraculi]|uniref:Helix-turn-helix domain-containing protein n=1 Tax=Cupriavidus respiraculi TaxID=195930 RepID=A0ABN7YD77_9BURK|nr:helix-turn-helix domain-containing protein [Cupriavidus respiraculi]CAG9171418.1 hypothetical protein LMG21510_01651 [Cupriavidus respiraculi]
MDAAISHAARALSAGDALAALNFVALRDDAPALALRGIAMAQLGDLPRASALLDGAVRAFDPTAAVPRARCVVAQAEIALALRDLRWPTRALEAARAVLEAHGDRVNAAHARYLDIRRLLLLGQLDEAEHRLLQLDPRSLPPAYQAAHELAIAGIAMRRVRARQAREALARAAAASRRAGIPGLLAEVESAGRMLAVPAARLVAGEQERPLLLDDVEALLASRAVVIDGCRHAVRHVRVVVPLARRPVLFALARALGQAWPGDVPRDALIAQAFRTRHRDASLRARLRVEIGRLRALLAPLADVRATPHGYALSPRDGRDVVVIARPIDEPHAAVLALLADGQSWASSALALALGASQRTVQRALDALARAGKVESIGSGRARLWTMPALPGFATSLLLPAPLTLD